MFFHENIASSVMKENKKNQRRVNVDGFKTPAFIFLIISYFSSHDKRCLFVFPDIFYNNFTR